MGIYVCMNIYGCKYVCVRACVCKYNVSPEFLVLIVITKLAGTLYSSVSCMYVCMYVYADLRVWIHVNKCVRVYTCVHIYVYIMHICINNVSAEFLVLAVITELAGTLHSSMSCMYAC